MGDLCVACGKPIATIRASNRIITLERVWTHYSWWANRSHRAIPREALRPEPAPTTTTETEGP